MKWDTGLTSDIPEYIRIIPLGGKKKKGNEPSLSAPLEWPDKKRFVALKDKKTGEVKYGTVEEIALKLDLSSSGVRSRLNTKVVKDNKVLYWINKQSFIKLTGRRYR